MIVRNVTDCGKSVRFVGMSKVDKVYKATTADMETFGGCKWKRGEWRDTGSSGTAKLAANLQKEQDERRGR